MLKKIFAVVLLIAFIMGDYIWYTVLTRTSLSAFVCVPFIKLIAIVAVPVFILVVIFMAIITKS